MKKKIECAENEIIMLRVSLYVYQIYELKTRGVKGQQRSFAAGVEVFVLLLLFFSVVVSFNCQFHRVPLKLIQEVIVQCNVFMKIITKSNFPWVPHSSLISSQVEFNIYNLNFFSGPYFNVSTKEINTIDQIFQMMLKGKFRCWEFFSLSFFEKIMEKCLI